MNAVIDQYTISSYVNMLQYVEKNIVESKGKSLIATSSTKIITSHIDSRCNYVTLREIKSA